MRGIPGRTYIERGEPVTAIVAWRQQRQAERLNLPGLEALGLWTPRNVLMRRADGSEVVRPFRGLRRAAVAVSPGLTTDSTTSRRSTDAVH